MAKEYLHPGVFREETPAEAVPIEGVATSTAAFLGATERGPMDSPQLITNWSQFVRTFGSYFAGSYLAYAMRGFFDNEGARCYVSRVSPTGVLKSTKTLKDRAGTPMDTLKIDAINEGTWGDGLTVTIEDGTADPTNEFNLIVKEDGVQVEKWENLSMIDADANYVEAVINEESTYIAVTDMDSATTPPGDRPSVQANTALTGGSDGTAADADWIGDESARTGFFSFDIIDDINILLSPGKYESAIVTAGLTYCENRADLIYVVDPQSGRTPTQIKTYREGFDSSYAAIYWPRIQIMDPVTGRPKYVPSSGHVAGIYARSDGDVGVHKAPANEIVRGAIGLEYDCTDGEQDVLNPAGVNVIRTFTRRGIRVWGARTMSSDPTLRYVHKRRTLLFIEESIEEGGQGFPFEPNDARLWGKIERSVGAFLRRQWLEGALFGESPSEAYYVKCDAETNTPETRAAGQVITEVGVVIVETGEFVIFRIGLWQGGSSVTE